MKTWRLIVWMEVLLPCVAPSHCKSMLHLLIRRRRLHEKYGDSPPPEKLDRVFELLYCPHCRMYLPGYDGWRARAFLNVFTGGLTRDQKGVIPYGIFAREEDIAPLVKSIINKAGQKTLINYEVILPQSQIHLVADIHNETLVKPITEKLQALINKEIRLPGVKSRGFNLIKITKIELQEIEDETEQLILQYPPQTENHKKPTTKKHTKQSEGTTR